MTRLTASLFFALLGVPVIPTSAQVGFLHHYQERVASTLVNQPHWATPLVTVNARIEQAFRSDFVRQTAPSGQKVWNDGNSKVSVYPASAP